VVLSVRQPQPGASAYGDEMQVLIVDGANVVGNRPDGWWRDRAGAARRLRERLAAAHLPQDEVVLVLEGAGRRGNPADERSGVRIVHAAGSGDDEIVDEVVRQVAAEGGRDVVVVTADRELQDRVVAAGGQTRGPSWLLEQL
jgi:predicted RNA-binding protein with PIN domain